MDTTLLCATDKDATAKRLQVESSWPSTNKSPCVQRSKPNAKLTGSETRSPRTCSMYGPPCECKGKVSNEGKSASMYSAFRWRVFSPGLDEIRRVPRSEERRVEKESRA